MSREKAKERIRNGMTGKVTRRRRRRRMEEGLSKLLLYNSFAIK
jgi:hypothetical protein